MIRYQSSRNSNETVSAHAAVIRGLAQDGGLYTPDCIPAHIDPSEVLNLSYPETAARIIGAMLDDYTAEEIEACVKGAYDEKFDTEEIVPLKKISDSWLMELWHGPTSAFKDIALTILPRLLTAAYKKDQRKDVISILTATSGDTGKAALSGFADVPNTRIIVFYPEDGVSDVQKLHPAQISVPQPVGKSWWFVRCADGSSLMFNKSGKLVSSISRSDTYGLNYIARSGMILDEKGNIAVDLTAKGLTTATTEENYAILADEKGNKYIYCNGKVIDFLINSKETVGDTEGNLILTQTVSGADTTVSVYNQTGEKLGSITNKLVTVAGSYLLAGDPSKQETVIYALK